jgi:hypothetical protein
MRAGLRALRGILVFLVLLGIGIGIALYYTTRPESRELDAQGRAWVAAYEPWLDTTHRRVTQARVEMGFDSEEQNARLIEPLRSCLTTLFELGDHPAFLGEVVEAAADACGRAEIAVGLNDEFGTSSLATIKNHLNEAEDRLRLSRRTLNLALAE